MIAQSDSADRRGLPDAAMRDCAIAYVRAGFAVHWLRASSKAPANQGWSTAPVLTEDLLRASYLPGYNLGVRLGEPSHVAGGWLHAFDIDVRDSGAADDAAEALKSLLPGVGLETFPTVASGSGGGSRHVYFISDKPLNSRKLWVSGEKFRDAGGKWHNTAEIDLFGSGRQIVLPPSIHPDSGKPYVWERSFDWDLLDLGIVPIISHAQLAEIIDPVDEAFEFEAIEPLTFKPGQLEAELDEISVDRIDDRDDWLTLGMALHHQTGGSEEGFRLWMKASSRGSKYLVNSSERAERQRYRGFGRSRRRPVTMASVRQWILDARRQSFADAFDDLPEMQESKEDEIGGDSSPTPDPLDAPVDMPWQSLLDVNPDTGVMRQHLHNVTLMVRHDPRTAGVPQKNLFTGETVQRQAVGTKPKKRSKQAKPVLQLTPATWVVSDPLNGTLWNDSRDNDLRRVFEAPKSQGGFGIKITDRDLSSAVEIVAQENSFHPVQEYLEGLEWDGTQRAESLFVDYLGADDNAYSREIARLMLVAAVTRIYEPGHKFDFAVIIEGIQGRGKSSFIQALGKHWFAELDGDFRDMKQMIELMQGAWIVEIPELSAFSRSDVRAIKAFISREVDRARLAYARRAAKFPRQCIFIGSTNDTQYLKDDTGGRRFWPIKGKCSTIDLSALRANVDLIWAEALHLYKDMRKGRPTGTLPLFLRDEESRRIAIESQDSRTLESSESVMAGQISAWLDAPVYSDPFEKCDAKQREVTCLREIWCECLREDGSLYGQGKAQLIGRAMDLVPGWEKGRFHDFAKYGKQRAFRRIYQPKV